MTLIEIILTVYFDVPLSNVATMPTKEELLLPSLFHINSLRRYIMKLTSATAPDSR